jgi:ribosomal protein S18 acetylase RimI-like enzyme
MPPRKTLSRFRAGENGSSRSRPVLAARRQAVILVRDSLGYRRRPMPDSIHLKPVAEGDFEYALGLYMDAMRPYVEEVHRWVDEEQRDWFAKRWNPRAARMIALNGETVGWLEAEDAGSEIRLNHIFVDPAQRGRGIGTQVLRALLPRWRARKPVVLLVVRSNPSIRLYRRLGFGVAGQSKLYYQLRAERLRPAEP